jgi:hypothetical protein
VVRRQPQWIGLIFWIKSRSLGLSQVLSSLRKQPPQLGHRYSVPNSKPPWDSPGKTAISSWVHSLQIHQTDGKAAVQGPRRWGGQLHNWTIHQETAPGSMVKHRPGHSWLKRVWESSLS